MTGLNVIGMQEIGPAARQGGEGMKVEMQKDIQKWQNYALLSFALGMLACLSALLGIGGLVSAGLNREPPSPWCWGGLGAALLFSLAAAAFRRFLWGRGVRHWKADIA